MCLTQSTNFDHHYGYFNDAGSETPVYDPPLTIPCLLCFKPLDEAPRITTSVMWQKGPINSYFYRVHKHCHEVATDAEIEELDCYMLDKERDEQK